MIQGCREEVEQAGRQETQASIWRDASGKHHGSRKVAGGVKAD